MTLEFITDEELAQEIGNDNSIPFYERKGFPIPEGLIKFVEQTGRCQDGYKDSRCLVNTNIRIFGKPVCSLHAIRAVDKICISFKRQLESLGAKPDYFFCCGDPDDCNDRCNRRLSLTDIPKEASSLPIL